MKTILLFILIMLLNSDLFSQNSNTDNRQLWLLTAKVSVNSTYKRDTIHSFTIENMKTETKFHQSSTTNVSSTISAVIENQAENPLKEFSYDSNAGESVNMSVTGKGMHISTTKGSETINGKLISAEERIDQVSGSALTEAYIQFSYSDDYKMVSITTNINATGTSDAHIYFDEWKDYGGQIEDYVIPCSGGCNMPDDKNCNISKTGKGYTASWSSIENKKGSTSNGIEYSTDETSIEVTLVPYKETDKPVVTIDGCTNPGLGEKSNITAIAKPKGGSYRFWSEPNDILFVTSDGSSSATITGLTPGKGLLLLEYTTPDGETAQTSIEASCVSIESYNNGEAIHQIALYDIDGKKMSGILTVPVKAKPADAVELVEFEPANPGVVSAVTVGSEVTLQGLITGKTTLQAKTKCGADTGPALEVEVVTCDDETIDRLEKMKKAAIENLVAAAKDLQSVAGSKEFEKARDELVSSYIELLAKVGLTIITQGKTKGIITKIEKIKNIEKVTESAAIPLAAQVADYGSALSEMIGSGNLEEFAGNVAKPTSGEAFERAVKLKFGEVTEGLYGKSLGAIIGLVEVGMATDKFYNNVGQLIHHEDMVEKFQEILEKADKELKNIQRRQQLCGKKEVKSNDQDIPLADLKPLPKEPTAPTKPTQKTEDSPAQNPQPNEPTSNDQTADDQVLIDPEFPKPPSRQVGLPYEPSDCGCDKTKDLTVKSTDFSTLGTGLKNLGECVQQFRSTLLTDCQQALEELSTLTQSLSTTLQTDAATFLVKAKESKPQLDSLINRVKAYDEAGNVFLNKMEKCPESITTGMEILQSVEKITVESLKLKY